MPEPHTIRLRGPWDYQPLERFDRPGELPPADRVQAPCDWSKTLGREFLGRVRYTRRFNRPTNLEAHERVWLVIDGVDPVGSVTLNGQWLGQAAGHDVVARYDVTARLEPYNLLTIEIRLDQNQYHDATLRGARAGGAGGLVGEVRLEIDAAP